MICSKVCQIAAEFERASHFEFGSNEAKNWRKVQQRYRLTSERVRRRFTDDLTRCALNFLEVVQEQTIPAFLTN